jgi:hypothetical protein
MALEVLHYIVTHEMVHLAVPDHSRKFWLTVQPVPRDRTGAAVAGGQRAADSVDVISRDFISQTEPG